MAKQEHESTPDQSDEGPVIVLPEERRAQLEKKLAEYKQRLYGPEPDAIRHHPDALLVIAPHIAYRIRVLEKLLKEGKVSTYPFSLELDEAVGGRLDLEEFEQACGIIRDYCQTGGKNVTGGTGLPTSSPILPSSSPMVE